MQVRAKFRCNSIEQFGGTNKKVRLQPVTAYSGSPSDASEEDRAFWAATPSGSLEMHVSNPSAADYFEIGKSYYLTFEAAE
jgi:hypothetical protein